MSYRSALIWTLVLGMIPAAIFLITHIPKRWSVTAIDASGWLVVIAGLYGWSLQRILTSDSHAPWSGDRIIGIAIGWFLNIIIWLRLIHWYVYLRRERQQEHNGKREP